MTPLFISKAEMIAFFGKPYFGFTVTRTGGNYHQTGIWIRDDLPENVTVSVLAHEKQHYSDNAFTDGKVLHWEIRAYIAGFNASPSGFFRSILISLLDVDRVKLYLQRIARGF